MFTGQSVPCEHGRGPSVPRLSTSPPDHPPFAALSDNDSELSKVSSDSARCHSSLADQQASRAMKHQEALVLDALDWNVPHIGTGNRFADRGRISGVVLGSSPHVGFYIGWRNQSHIVSEPPNPARPVVSGGAGLDADQARCKRGENDMISPRRRRWRLVTWPWLSTAWM
jgi:hypothetical protein